MQATQLYRALRYFIWLFVLGLPVVYGLGLYNVPLLNILWLGALGWVLVDIFRHYAKRLDTL